MGLGRAFVIWGILCASAFANCPIILLDSSRYAELEGISLQELARQYYAFRAEEMRASVPTWKRQRAYWEKVSESDEYSEEYRAEAAQKAEKYELWSEVCAHPFDAKYLNFKIAALEVGGTGLVFIEALRFGAPDMDPEVRTFESSVRAPIFLDQILRKRLGLAACAETAQSRKPLLRESERDRALEVLEWLGGRPPAEGLLERIRQRPLVRAPVEDSPWGRVEIYRELVWNNATIRWTEEEDMKALREAIDELELLIANRQ